MDATLVAPFVESLRHVFETMLQLRLTARDPVTHRPLAPGETVIGAAVLSGGVVGSVTVRMPVGTGARIVSVFCGERVDESSEAFADALAELVNMTAGGAKPALASGRDVHVSRPEVRLDIAPAPSPNAVIVACDCECGRMWLEIAVRRAPAPECVAR